MIHLITAVESGELDLDDTTNMDTSPFYTVCISINHRTPTVNKLKTSMLFPKLGMRAIMIGLVDRIAVVRRITGVIHVIIEAGTVGWWKNHYSAPVFCLIIIKTGIKYITLGHLPQTSTKPCWKSKYAGYRARLPRYKAQPPHFRNKKNYLINIFSQGKINTGIFSSERQQGKMIGLTKKPNCTAKFVRSKRETKSLCSTEKTTRCQYQWVWSHWKCPR